MAPGARWPDGRSEVRKIHRARSDIRRHNDGFCDLAHLAGVCIAMASAVIHSYQEDFTIFPRAVSKRH